MSDTPLPLPEGLRWIKLVCRLGRLAHDGVDPDDKPDLLPTAGKVRLASSPARLRVQEPDGRWRSVSLDDREYTIRADGELVDTEGRVGVWIPDPASELLDPRPYTLVATVTPTVGERWAVKITGETLPDVVDLVAHSETVAIPASAVPGLSSRIASLEGILAAGSGDAFPAGAVPIFETLAQAEAWESENPGRVALTLEGSSDPTDTTPPIAGGLAVDMGHTTATLTVSGASDDRAVDSYSFKIDGGEWSDWQASHIYEATGLTGSTDYTFQHRVRDAAGNITEGIATTGTTLAAPPAQTGEVITSDGFSGTGATTGRMTDCEHGGTPIAWNGTIQVADGATDPATTSANQPVLPISREDVRVDFTVLDNPVTSLGSIRHRGGSVAVRVSYTGDISAVVDGGTPNRLLGGEITGARMVRLEVQGSDVRAWAWAAGETMPSGPNWTGTTAATGAHPLDISQRPGFSITDLVVTAL